jgi:hypothetical protein
MILILYWRRIGLQTLMLLIFNFLCSLFYFSLFFCQSCFDYLLKLPLPSYHFMVWSVHFNNFPCTTHRPPFSRLPCHWSSKVLGSLIIFQVEIASSVQPGLPTYIATIQLWGLNLNCDRLCDRLYIICITRIALQHVDGWMWNWKQLIWIQVG